MGQLEQRLDPSPSQSLIVLYECTNGLETRRAVVDHKATLQSQSEFVMPDIWSLHTFGVGILSDLIGNFRCAAEVERQRGFVLAVVENFGDVEGVLTELIVCSTDKLAAQLNCGKGIQAVKNKPRCFGVGGSASYDQSHVQTPISVHGSCILTIHPKDDLCMSNCYPGSNASRNHSDHSIYMCIGN